MFGCMLLLLFVVSVLFLCVEGSLPLLLCYVMVCCVCDVLCFCS